MDNEKTKNILKRNHNELKKIAEKIRENDLTDSERLDIFDNMRDDIAKLVEISAESNLKLSKEI